MRMSRGRFFEVEKILARRQHCNNRVEYLVRWRGYSKDHDTWEPLKNLHTCRDLLVEFNAANRDRPSSPPPNKKPIGSPTPSVKQRRVIKPVKIFSPDSPKQSVRPRINTEKTRSSPGKRNPPVPRSSPSSKSGRSAGVTKPDLRTLRRLRHRKRSTSPVRKRPVPNELKSSLSPMSKKALDHFLASRAKNFNHLNRIQTRPPSADHEYFSSESKLFSFSPRTVDGVEAGSALPNSNCRTAANNGPSSQFLGTLAIPPNGNGSRVLSRPKQFITLKRGKCMEIIISNQSENNSITPEALNEIVRMLDDAATGPVTFVIFRSVNDFFCSGLSIGSFCKRVDSGASQAVLAERDFVNCLIDFPKPLMAVIRGPAIGLGCAILPHFDTVYCSERAYFALPYTEIGLVPEACSTYLFPKILGHCLANDMLLNGKPITANEAKASGLVSEVFRHDSLEQNVLPLAKHLTTKSLQALVTTKTLIRNPEKAKLKQVNQCEYVAARARWEHPGTLASIKRYLEKLDNAQ